MLASHMFEQYPKSRPPLPLEYARIYNEYYLCNRGGHSPASALSRTMEAWMHRQVAVDARRAQNPGATLEIGAGTLNHLHYEPHTTPYDIVEPSSYLYQSAASTASLNRVRNVYTDMKCVPESNYYSRIISIATLEHVCELPELIARSALHLVIGGVLRAAVPSEGSILWQLAQDVSSGLEFRLRYGLDYRVLRRHDHVNRADEIEQVLEYFFSSVKCRVFGVSRRLSIYQSFTCFEPHDERCRAYLSLVPSIGSSTRPGNHR
jgi:hypothetical protein